MKTFRSFRELKAYYHAGTVQTEKTRQEKRREARENKEVLRDYGKPLNLSAR